MIMFADIESDGGNVITYICDDYDRTCQQIHNLNTKIESLSKYKFIQKYKLSNKKSDLIIHKNNINWYLATYHIHCHNSKSFN